MSYQIITDNCCDMEPALYEKLGVTVINLSMLYKGQVHQDMDEAFIKAFYNGMREGEVATTSAVNPDGWAQVIEPARQAGKDALADLAPISGAEGGMTFAPNVSSVRRYFRENGMFM